MKVFGNQLSNVSKNALWIIGSKLLKAVLTMIVTMLTARYLGPNNYGLIGYAASIVTFVAPIMKLGFDAVMVYEFVNHRDEEGEIIGTSFVLNLLSALFCIIGVTTFASIVHKNEPQTILVCALYSSMLIFQALEMIQYWFQSRLLSKYVAVTMLFSYVAISAYQIFLLATGKSVFWFAIVNALDFLIISAVLIVIYRRLKGQLFSFSTDCAKRLLSESKYYIVSGMMVTIFQHTDQIMLKIMCSNDSVGFYLAALTCATMFSFVFAAIIDSYRSTIFEKKNVSQDAFLEQLSKLYSLVTYCSLAVSLLMSLFSEQVVYIMYGSQYESAVPLLRILVWFTTFSYLGTIRDIWILSEGLQKYIYVINFFGAALNVVLNALAIPFWGAAGAAIASLATQIFTNFILCWIIKPFRPIGKIIIQSLNFRRFFVSSTKKA